MVTDEHVVLAIDPPHLLSHTFHPLLEELREEPPSRVTFSMAQEDDIVRLKVVHDEFAPGSKVFPACREGWPLILTSLKTLLEMRTALPR